MEERKDNRLLSGLIDLRLAKRNDSAQEDVTMFLVREKGNRRSWGHLGLSMTIRSIRTSWRLSRRKLLVIKHLFLRVLRIISLLPT
jgi:hypothetical protein